MRRLIGRILAWIGGFVVVAALMLVIAALLLHTSSTKVAQNTVLELDLQTDLTEQASGDPLAQLQDGDRPTVRSILLALQRAAGDPRVKALIVRVGASPMMPAHAQEIRDGIQEFRKAHKRAVAFAEEFGDSNSGLTSYYLATACDEIWMQPGSFFEASGLRYQVPFVKGALDKLGLAPRFEGRKEFKNAINTFLEKQFTPAHKEAEERLLVSTYGQYARAMSQGRKLQEAQLRTVLESGPHSGDRALQLKLIDGLGYRDEVYANVKNRAGKDAKLLWLGAYAARTDPMYAKGKRIALIYGVGAITTGRSGFDPMEGQSMGSETISSAFRKAVDDKDVKAIIFRVDSPGGSVVASETIWREVMRARAARKPVVVSMSGLAASGGYYVSMHADRIIAQPATITGSIGVFGGKMFTKGLWEKLGVTFDQVQTAPNASLYDGYEDFTPEQWQVVRGMLDSIYSQFTTKVAQGRKLPVEKVQDVAKGRVWTGEDALARGLVDELGGFPAAISSARKLAHIPEREDIELKVYPPQKSRWEALMALIEGEHEDSSDPDEEVALRSMLRRLQPAARLLQQLGVTRTREQWLRVPPSGIMDPHR